MSRGLSITAVAFVLLAGCTDTDTTDPAVDRLVTAQPGGGFAESVAVPGGSLTTTLYDADGDAVRMTTEPSWVPLTRGGSDEATVTETMAWANHSIVDAFGCVTDDSGGADHCLSLVPSQAARALLKSIQVPAKGDSSYGPCTYGYAYSCYYYTLPYLEGCYVGYGYGLCQQWQWSSCVSWGAYQCSGW